MAMVLPLTNEFGQRLFNMEDRIGARMRPAEDGKLPERWSRESMWTKSGHVGDLLKPGVFERLGAYLIEHGYPANRACRYGKLSKSGRSPRVVFIAGKEFIESAGRIHERSVGAE